jgi:hypothetical protein
MQSVPASSARATARALATSAARARVSAADPLALHGARNLYPLSSAKSRRSRALLLRGEGIGNEVTDALVDVLKAAKAPVELVAPKVGLNIDPSCLTTEVTDLFNETRVAMKVRCLVK